jgi:UDP-N-acetylmuramoylalanine--D-glutamate ligase
MDFDLSNCQRIAVIGLGKTGASVVNYLLTLGKKVCAFDSSSDPSELSKIQSTIAADQIFLGPYDQSLLSSFDLIVVSPGVNLQQPVFLHLKENGALICGDIELFCKINTIAIIAITGSNGKTTLTTLTEKLLRKTGRLAIAAGNIGTPVLETIGNTGLDYVIMELSSFQLATTYCLNAAVAVVLNCTPDHLDRHCSFEEYRNAKLSIYKNARHAVINSDDPALKPTHPQNKISFGVNENADFTYCTEPTGVYFYYHGKKIGSAVNWPLQGQHHFQNALALLAIAKAIDIPFDDVFHVLERFRGIPHRCELITQHAGVRWYNDSKATNEGAAVAAIKTLSMSLEGRLILIAGGEAKGCDFSLLKEVVQQCVSDVIVLGRDAALLTQVLSPVAKVQSVTSMADAVNQAKDLAREKDIVLLSPACASFDMFEHYQHRGQEFSRCVYEEIS